MPLSETLKSYLKTKRVAYELLPHPESHSARETAKLAHVNEDHIAKAVIVKDELGYAMVVLPGSDMIKIHSIQKELNRHFQLATEDELNELFADCKQGAIPPFGQAYGLQTFLDERLTTLANIYFEAGDHEYLVHIKGDDFLAMFKGIRHGHFSH